MGGVPHQRSERLESLLCLLLLAATLAVFQGVTEHEFMSFDDIQYVTENPHVRSGTTLKDLRWSPSGTPPLCMRWGPPCRWDTVADQVRR